MTTEELSVDDEAIVDDTAEYGGGEDLDDPDTLEAALGALGDDDEPLDEQTADDEGDFDEDEELSDADETEEDADFEDGDEVLVAMPGGEELPLGELKRGYLRHRDYTHKTEDVARAREIVEDMHDTYVERNQSLQNAFQNLTEFVGGMIPAEPDVSLARTDPGRYQEAMALRDRAIRDVQGLLQAKQEVDESAYIADSEDFARMVAGEDGALVQAMPVLKDPGRRAAFDAANRQTAQEFGFSDEEISTTIDHRILQLVHYARLGKIAETNRKNAARRINDKPRRGGPSLPATGKRSRSREAMKRLSTTGSMDDAMSIDFD